MTLTEASINKISESYLEINDVVQGLKISSQELSTAASVSACTIEETSASLTEISSLVKNIQIDSEKTMQTSK
jgi:methyl-accepting chemotaxis protein